MKNLVFISLPYGEKLKKNLIVKKRQSNIFLAKFAGSDGYRYPSTDTVSVKTTKIVSVFVSVSALEIFCIRIRIRPKIFLYPYPFLNFFGFVSVSVINSKFIWIFFGACFIE